MFRERWGTDMKKLFLLFLFIANVASAAKLDDVEVLSVTTGKDSHEIKLHTKQGPPGSYFFVKIAKSDAELFSKLGHVIKKLEKGKKYKLSLNIVSFSMSPSGSSYPSEDVEFSGSQKP